jgi:hypothetical protein
MADLAGLADVDQRAGHDLRVDVLYTFTAVPEPATLVLLAVGAITIGVRGAITASGRRRV